MRKMLALSAVFAAACSPQPQQQAEPAPASAPASATDIPAGTYTLDRAHSTLIFRVNHIGFSRYTAQFGEFDVTLELNPADPARSSVAVVIPVRSLELPAPPQGFRDTLLGPAWFDATRFAEIRFQSTEVELTGPNTARITGDLILHGVTRPIVLDATFNGGYAEHPFDPNARVGFSAHASFKRSDFGMAVGLPPPGSTMGVGDDVEVAIETEFNGPPAARAAP